jgi:hypothetical protein
MRPNRGSNIKIHDHSGGGGNAAVDMMMMMIMIQFYRTELRSE